jgi:hypothetical protein
MDELIPVDTIVNIIQRYRRYPNETRFMMLLDKLYIVLETSPMFVHDKHKFLSESIQKNNEENKEERQNKLNQDRDKILNCIDMIKHELDDLQQYLFKHNDTLLDTIDKKLDSVLLGPDYPQGKNLMNEAKNDFDSQLKK